MKIGILGTGMVGIALGTKLVQLGNQVMMGSRTVDNKAATEWAAESGSGASHGTFEDAAKFGEMILLCTNGQATLDALRMAGHDNLNGKTVIDTTNPLDFSGGTLKLTVCNTDSLGEQIQREVPGANFVKTLNTAGSTLMIDPKQIGEEITMFVCGNSDKAKGDAIEMLRNFGWTDIIDLGDISAARGMEMAVPLWMRIFTKWGTGTTFALKVARKK